MSHLSLLFLHSIFLPNSPVLKEKFGYLARDWRVHPDDRSSGQLEAHFSKRNVGGGFFCLDVSLFDAQCSFSFHQGSKRGKKRKVARQEPPRAASPIPELFDLAQPVLGEEIMTNSDRQQEALRAATELARGADDEQLAVGEISADDVRRALQDHYRASRKQLAEMLREARGLKRDRN